MKTHLRVAVGLLATLTLAPVVAAGQPVATSADATDNAVVYWSGVAESAIAAGRPPASSTVLGGMVHGAMYDAVAAVEGGLEPFVTRVTAPPGASADAAVAQAARDVLVTRVPAQAGAVQTAFDAYLAAIPAGPAKQAGVAVGAAAAAGMLAARLGDHYDDVVPYVQPAPGPGVFEPIAPTPPVDTKLAAVRPFTYDAQSAYRPDAPYRLTSKQYAADVDELQALGRVDSTERTAEQTETVRFFTDQTFVQYSRALRGLVEAQGLDLSESARLLAYVHVSAADTMIACWEAKYHYMFWRPNHAIAAGRHRRQRRDVTGPDVAAIGHRQPPGVPVRSRLHHRRSDRVAASLLRHQARRAHRHQRRRREGADVRPARRPGRRRRGRPRLGRAALPDDDAGDLEALPGDRPRHREALLPAHRALTSRPTVGVPSWRRPSALPSLSCRTITPPRPAPAPTTARPAGRGGPRRSGSSTRCPRHSSRRPAGRRRRGGSPSRSCTPSCRPRPCA